MRYILLTVLLAGCGLLPQPTPPPVPSVEDARAVLDEVIQAGIDRDWQRLCAHASETCENELDAEQSWRDRAPALAPTVELIGVVQPTANSSGGVHFALCGIDAFEDPYESEVLVFDARDRILVTGAVYWVGTGIVFTDEDGFVDVGGPPNQGEDRCP